MGDNKKWQLVRQHEMRFYLNTMHYIKKSKFNSNNKIIGSAI